jgi:hypothetical protein
MTQFLEVIAGIPIALAIYGVVTVAVKARIRWVGRKQVAVAGGER